jgi:hypothetical protein
MRLRATFAMALAVGVGSLGIGFGWRMGRGPVRGLRDSRRPRDFEPLVRMGPVPPIAEVPAIPAALLAPGRVVDEESVLGLVLGVEARAYPLAMIRTIDREVLNDRLGGRAILVSWCNLCQTGRVFARQFDGTELRFASAGMTWHENLVLRDLETGSLWSQMFGEAMQGPLDGVQLEALSTVVTDWKTWKEQYPDTTVLVLDRKGEALPHRLRYPPESGDAFLLGVASDDAARGWTLDRLRAHPVINDDFDGRPVLVVFDSERSTAALFDRKLGGRVLSFHRRGRDLVDDQTDSTWELTGRARSGALQGRHLDPIPTTLAYRARWLDFYPDTRFWTAPANVAIDAATAHVALDNAD